MVLAGAGSGKTGVIAAKVAHLIDVAGLAPERIAAITFTNKAAREMRARVRTLLGKRDAKPWISTFHTLGLRILREEYRALGYRPGFSILDASDCAGSLCIPLLTVPELAVLATFQPRIVKMARAGERPED